jgi:outer membrane receptor for ferrienterochelin and colicins
MALLYFTLLVFATDVDEAKDFDVFSILAEEVTVTAATKVESRPSEAPAVVSVVTRQQIQHYGYQSLADVLRATLGFFVIDDHILASAAVRGTSGGLFSESGVVKVIVDGQATSFRTTAGNWIGPELLPMSAIERIEIVRGPASSIYGADAFLGVINIVTRKGASLNGATMRATGGVVGRAPAWDLDASVGGMKGPVEMLFSARIAEEDRSGLRLSPTSPEPRLPLGRSVNDPATSLTLRSAVGHGKISYHLGEASSVSLTGYLSAVDRGAEFSPWLQLTNGADATGSNSQTLISLMHGWLGIGADLHPTRNFDLSLRATYFAGGPTARDRVDLGTSLFYVKRRFGFRGFDANAEARWRPLERWVFVAGGGVIYDAEKAPSNAHILKRATPSNDAGTTISPAAATAADVTLINPAIYAQAIYTAIPKYLTVTGGVRYDYHTIYRHQVSGRAGLVSNPINKLFLKLLYGNAFKAPSPYLLFAAPLRSGDVIGNPQLKPQKVHTIELEASYDPLPFLRATSSVSYSFLSDAASFTQQGEYQIARNVAQTHGISWETRVDAHHSDLVDVYASFEANRTTRVLGQEGYVAQTIGSANVVYPAFLGHLGAHGRVPRTPLEVAVDTTWVGARDPSDTNIIASGQRYSLKPYVLLSATLSVARVKLFGDLETTFTLLGKNLLEPAAADPGFTGIDYPLAPRSVMLNVTQSL